MAHRNPPPRTLEPQEERRIQRFLERAAPIVLEHPVLKTEQWGLLVALAEELDLSDEQFRQTIDELRERGVIRSIDLTPAKPPPLPRPNAATAIPRREQVASERDFSLTPPPPPPPPRRVRPSVAVAASTTQKERFREEAAAIIARHQGVDTQAKILLAKTAKDLGLNDDEAAEAIMSLHGPAVPQPRDEPAPSPPSPPSPPIVASPSPQIAATPPAPAAIAAVVEYGDPGQRRRWRIDGDAAPEPPTPTKEPAETFREYLQQSLAQVRDSSVPTELEQRFVLHGTRVLGLSQVFARHLFLEVVAENQLGLASRDETKAGEPSGSSPLSPAMRSFLARAAPVLAQERGINAKSRVLLAALARELGLSDAEMEQSLASLQRPLSDAQRIHMERLEPFRDFVRTTISRLPHRILTANVEGKLATSGRLSYGLAEERIRPIIRELASEMDVAVVSEEQAERHVRELVAEWLGDALRLSAENRDRVQAEGARWGLLAARIDGIIKERVQANHQRYRSERRMASLALAAASMAVLFVVGFFCWAILENEFASETAIPLGPRTHSVTSPPASPSGDAWWDGELAVAVQEARLMFPQLGKPLRELKSLEAPRRGGAYEELIQEMLDTADDEQRAVLLRILVRCFALDEVEENAQRISAALLRAIPEPGAALSPDAAQYPRAFRATRAAVETLLRAPQNAPRTAKLAEELGRVTGNPIELKQPARRWEQQCLGGLAERFYRLLISAAATQPQTIGALYAVVSVQAAGYLDATMIDKLNADYLTSLLTAAADMWRQYAELIRKTIDSPDDVAVVRLLDLYEHTTNRELQGFMSGLLLQRANALAEPATVAEIAAEVRKTLGVNDSALGDDRWTWLSRSAERALNEIAPASEPDPQMLQNIVTLAHQSTLACALAQGERGLPTFDELRKKGALDLKAELDIGSDETSASSAPGGGNYSMIRQSLQTLSNRQSGPTGRVSRLESLAASATRITDVLPEDAEKLAAYLLSLKVEAEHRAVLRVAKSLARWRHLRLALADHLSEAKLRPEQLRGLLKEILDRPVEIGVGDEAREAVRAELLQSVLIEINLDAGRSSHTYRAYDTAHDELRRLYGMQSQLLGISPADDPSWKTTAQLLQHVIGEYAAALNSQVRDPAIQQAFSGVPHELAAAKFVASDDLHLTVQVERTWIRLLAIAVAGRYPARQEKSAAILDELRAADARCKHIVPQLHSGQSAILRLWLLWNQPDT